jgi:hypothetical protein
MPSKDRWPAILLAALVELLAALVELLAQAARLPDVLDQRDVSSELDPSATSPSLDALDAPRWLCLGGRWDQCEVPGGHLLELGGKWVRDRAARQHQRAHPEAAFTSMVSVLVRASTRKLSAAPAYGCVAVDIGHVLRPNYLLSLINTWKVFADPGRIASGSYDPRAIPRQPNRRDPSPPDDSGRDPAPAL